MTNAKKRHKFVLWGQPKVFRTHFQQKTRKMCEKIAPRGPPHPPPTPWNAFFCWGRMCTKWPIPKNAISLFYGVNLRCFVPIFWLLGGIFRQKVLFLAISGARTKNLFYSNFLFRPKYYESSKTEYSFSTYLFNRLDPQPQKAIKSSRKSPPWPPVTPPNPLRWTIFVSTYKLRPVKTIFNSWP